MKDFMLGEGCSDFAAEFNSTEWRQNLWYESSCEATLIPIAVKECINTVLVPSLLVAAILVIISKFVNSRRSREV